MIMNCEFCSGEFNKKGGYANHVRRCTKNPNRIHEVLTAEGRARISATTTAQNKTKWADPVIAKKHRESMKRIAQERPESYSSSNRGRTKQIIVDDIKFQGQWEVDFYLWAKEQNLNPNKPTTGFKYEWNGVRVYYPDFYLPSLELYVEVKGYETDRDRAKWENFPNTLSIIKEAEIKQIRNGEFTVDKLLSKCYSNVWAGSSTG